MPVTQTLPATVTDLLFEKVSVGVCLVAPDGTVVRANAEWLRSTGFTEEQVIGESLVDLFPAARDMALALHARARAGHRVEVPRHAQVIHGRDTWWEGSIDPVPMEGGTGLLVTAREVGPATDQQWREVELRESEQRYRTLFTHMTEGFALGEAICDAAGAPVDFRFLEMNEAFERQSGLKRETTRGRPMREVLAGLEPSWIETCCGVALGGPDRRFESYNRDVDRHFAVCCFRPSAGRFAVVFTDITDRKRAAEAAARDRDLLTRLFERLPVMIAMYDPRLGAFRFNDEFRRVLGWTEDDAAAGNLLALVDPDPAGGARAVGHMTSPAPGWREVPVTARNGSTVPSSWANLRLADDTHVGIGIDLRERKRHEAALRASEQRLRVHVETTPLALVEWDAEYRVVGYSRRAEELFGYAPEEVLGKRLDEIPWVPDEEWPAVRAVMRDMASGARRVNVNANRNVRKDGSVLYCEWYNSSLHDDAGRLRSVLSLVLDVTERKRAERALLDANERLRDADRRKDEFLGMLSHELRNPLAPIRNATYVLHHALPGGEQAHRAHGVIQRQTEHLTRLVDDLLDVTRIARGKIELRRARVDLRDVVWRAADDFRLLLRDRGVAFEIEVPGEQLWADADATRVTQIVGNLLHNASKFTRSGDTVLLSMEARGGNAEIRVRDTGAGIDPELLPNVFDAFVQGKRTLARTEGGLGLGLAQVKGIAELHGGSAAAESAGVGKGAAFTVRLPLAEPPRAEVRGGDAQPRARGRRRVLVVDDNTDAAETLADLVRMLGHEAHVAYDGAAAIEAAKAMRPDVVLCDIGLPRVDGYEVARALRAAGLAGVQLVAVSGYAQAEDVSRALDAGFDAHLAKPCDPERIARLLA